MKYLFTSVFLDSTLKYDWDMKIADRAFDNIKVDKYLSLLNEPDKSFVRDLINNTTYINYLQFKNALTRSFRLFMNNIGEDGFYLILPSDKIGSEHWLTTLLWPQLRNLNIIKIIEQDDTSIFENFANQTYNILIIDDAYYTATNTFVKIDNISYPLSEKLGKSREEIGKYFKFHILIPFISTEGTNFIVDECKLLDAQYIIYGIYYLPALKELLNIEKYYPENSEIILRDRFHISLKLDLPISNMPAVYFDHKVAAPESTFSSIYLEGTLPNNMEFGSLFKLNPSREKIMELENLFISHNS